MKTITIRNAEHLSKTEFEDLDDLKAYLLENERTDLENSNTLIGLSEKEIGKLWDIGVASGEPIAFDKEKEQDFLQKMEQKYSK